MSFEIDDKEIIKKYLEGDEKSLEILIKKYLNSIYGFIFKNVGDINSAEDITQEVFIRIWKNLKKFDQKKEFKPWIFQIAKNASIDYLRKKKSIPFSRFENDKGQNVLTENLSDNSPNLLKILNDKKGLMIIMEALPEKDKNLLNLRHKDGLSFKEIADITNESVNTIKSRYRRIIINLKNNPNIRE
jgi:RNA polymerase sigma-70 factor (ECF subfamily)